MNIVILDDYQDAVRKLACASKLESLNAKVYTNTIKGMGQLAVRLRDAEILVLIRERTAITRQLLEKLPKLRLIVQTGSPGNHIDLQACTDCGVAVVAGEEDPRTIAEFTWALLMSAARRIPQYMGNLRHGVWQQSGLKSASMPPNFGLGAVLHGKTLGIWGFGRIGQLVAGYGKAFGMQVMVWGSAASRDAALQAGCTAASSRAQLFAESDFLSLHLRLTAETRGLIGLDDLSRMKTTAVLVNTAHAELIPSDVLIAALNRGRPGMAALDVLEQEPVMAGNTLLRLENCLCTPHIGDVELQSYEREFGAAFDAVLAFINSQPVDVLNPEVRQIRMPL